MFNVFTIFTELARLYCFIIAWMFKKSGNEKKHLKWQAKKDRWQQWSMFMEGSGPEPSKKVKS